MYQNPFYNLNTDILQYVRSFLQIQDIKVFDHETPTKEVYPFIFPLHNNFIMQFKLFDISSNLYTVPNIRININHMIQIQCFTVGNNIIYIQNEQMNKLLPFNNSYITIIILIYILYFIVHIYKIIIIILKSQR